MKRLVLMALLALALPLASWANSSNLVFSNTGGKIAVGGTSIAPTLNVGNSVLTSFTGFSGVPNGTLFQGTFSGPVNWIAIFNPHGNHNKGNWTYVLTGNVSGTLSNGAAAAGGTLQITFDVPGSKQFSKGVNLRSGFTTVTVPEPGTLGLLGTGLVGIAGLIRRRMRNSA